MPIALLNADAIAAKQDVGTDINFEINGDERTAGVDSYKKLAQGALAAAAATLYSPGAANKEAIIQNLTLTNTGATTRTVTLYKHGTGTAQIWGIIVLNANEWAEWNGGWTTYTASGLAKVATVSTAGAVYYVNVKDYGAKGDGVADDTAAIKAARDDGLAKYSATFGWTLFFPAGRYLVSGVIAFTTAQLSVRGTGFGDCQLFTNGTYTAGDIFTFGAQSQISIQDIGFVTGTTRTSGSFIAFNGTSTSRISRILCFTNFRAITCTTPSQNIFIDNVQINGSATASCIGIEINSPNFGDFYIDHVLANNTNSGGAGLQVGTGLSLLASLFTCVSNCDFVGWKNGIAVAPVAGTAVTWTYMTNVLCDTCSASGLLISSATTTSSIRGFFSTNCWYSTNNQDASPAGHGGVEINVVTGGATCDDIRFVAAEVINNGAHGVICTGTGVTAIREFAMLNSTIMGNGTKTANTYDGVQVGAGQSNFRIFGNRIGGNFNTFTVQQRYGVNVPAGASNNYLIKNNDVSGNTTGNNTAAIFDGGTGISKDTTPNLGSSGEIAIATKNNAASLYAAEAIVVGPAPLWGKEVKVGSTFRVTCSGVATFTLGGTMIFKLRAGTLGTTGDAVFFTCPTLTTAVGGPIAYKLVIDFMVTAVGANNTILATMTLTNGNTGNVVGIHNLAQVANPGTPATFPNTVTMMELTALGATSTGAGITAQGVIEQLA